jgi:hypothetical protein
MEVAKVYNFGVSVVGEDSDRVAYSSALKVTGPGYTDVLCRIQRPGIHGQTVSSVHE